MTTPPIDPTGTTEELVSRNPATLETLGASPVTDEARLDGLVTAGHAASRSWRIDIDARRAALAAISDGILAGIGGLAPQLTAEQGKPLAEAKQEIWVAAQAFAATASAAWEPTRTATAATGRPVTVQQRPFGVVAGIVPWNFPVYLAAAKIAPALLSGNAVLVKPAETVSLVLTAFVDLLRGHLPEGLIDVVIGGPEVTGALIDHPGVGKVSFTGSTAVGREIIRLSAPSITPVTLELGGNDPAILLPDADLGDAAARLAAGAFMNAGQMCIAPKRAYVPTGLVDEFAELVATHSQRTVGDGREESTTMGPLHNRRQLDIVAGMLDKATSAGARAVSGAAPGTDLPGHFLEPTVITGVDDADDIVRLEQFGPLFPIVGYDDLDAVLTTVDGQEFGLGASVWGADADAALATAERIDAGTVWINQHNALDVALPFGGVKASGFGREGGIAGIEEFTTTRVIDPRPGEGTRK